MQLDFGKNEISDIDELEKVDYKELKFLDLRGNEISDIDILEKVNLGGLKQLNLNNNELTDIDILAKVDFKELNNLFFKFKYLFSAEKKYGFFMNFIKLILREIYTKIFSLKAI